MNRLPLQLEPEEPEPLYRQVYTQIRQLTLKGHVLPGSKLPPTRHLAEQQQVARVTITQAYEQLTAEGFTISRVGAGTFVVDDLEPLISPHPFQPQLTPWARGLPARRRAGPVAWPTGSRPAIDFGFGRSFPHIFPYDIWRRLLARYLSTDDVMLSRYGSAAGFGPLREAVAHYLNRLRGVHCRAEQVVIVSGMQQALDLLARLLLRQGDEVLVETPGYRDAFHLFKLHGARLRPLAVGYEGFPVADIPPESEARFVFITPSNQFPKGGAMPVAQRLALLHWARQQGAVLIEDDYDGELRYDSSPISALQGLDVDGRVVYIGTFSKVLFPALRLGYLVLPDNLLTPFLQAKRTLDRGAPTLTQAAVADFIMEGYFERHLRRLRVEYGQRRQVLVEALDEHLAGQVTFAREEAGLHVMVYLPEALEETAVINAAAQVGLGLYPGTPYHLVPTPPPSILLGFSGLSQQDIKIGIHRLAQVIRKL